jgi:hypothetical protein
MSSVVSLSARKRPCEAFDSLNVRTIIVGQQFGRLRWREVESRKSAGYRYDEALNGVSEGITDGAQRCSPLSLTAVTALGPWLTGQDTMRHPYGAS